MPDLQANRCGPPLKFRDRQMTGQQDTAIARNGPISSTHAPLGQKPWAKGAQASSQDYRIGPPCSEASPKQMGNGLVVQRHGVTPGEPADQGRDGAGAWLLSDG
jgi:hypothetical protein